MNPRKKFRALVATPGFAIVPGAYDTLTARLVQLAGFDAVYLTGGGYSRANGYPDVGLLTMTEVVEWISRTVEAVEIPVIADMDSGYGNALNVVRSVRQYEKTGVAAFHLEDQVSPKKCGHYEGKQLVSKAEMIGKIKAAVDARRDPDFVIVSRTDAAGPLGVDEAIRRLNLYAEAGADCLYADALLSKEDIAKVAKGVPKPLIVNMGLGMRSRKTTPLMTPKALQALGVAAVSYPRLLSTAALKGMMNAMAVFKEEVLEKDRVVDRPDLLVSFDELNELMGMAELDGLERRFLGG